MFALVQLNAGEIIFREGDPGNLLYLVGEGSVKISKSGRGGQQETLGFIQSGNFFGEMASARWRAPFRHGHGR